MATPTERLGLDFVPRDSRVRLPVKGGEFMALPARCLFTVLEVSVRWQCSQTQIVDWAISDEIDLVAGFGEVRFGDEAAAGLMSVAVFSAPASAETTPSGSGR